VSLLAGGRLHAPRNSAVYPLQESLNHNLIALACYADNSSPQGSRVVLSSFSDCNQQFFNPNSVSGTVEVNAIGILESRRKISSGINQPSANI
jgi:hypothetical protein